MLQMQIHKWVMICLHNKQTSGGSMRTAGVQIQSLSIGILFRRPFPTSFSDLSLSENHAID